MTFFISYSYAKSYTLYLASTKYVEVAKDYYHDIRFRTPDFYDVIIRTHEKNNYSVIIRQIPTIQKAKSIQKLFFAQDKYKDSYIKRFDVEPTYNIVEIEEKLRLNKIKEKAFKQDIENSNGYILASTMYNTGQYKKAYDMFFKLFLKDNYNLNINYFLAKSAFSIKRYDEATAAFERVLIANQNFHQARYDFAKVLYIVKQNNEAKKEFQKLLNSDIKNKTKEEIKKYLSILNRKKKRVNGSANVMLGLVRSTNVNNGLISPEYRLPGLNDILVNGEKPIADYAHFQAINFNFYNYFKTKPLRIKNSFLIYNKSYFNEKDENLTVFSYKPSLDYINNGNLYTIEIATDKIRKKTDEDFYAFSISPKYKTKDIETHLKYQRIMYDKNIYEEKDFDKIQLYAKVNLFKNFNFYTNIYKNERIKNLRTDIDKKTIANGFNLFYYITNKNQINLNYEFEYSSYKHKNIGFDTKRKDKNHLIELSLKHAIDRANIINLSTSYTKNYSNQDSYIYDEKAIKINYIKGYNW